MTDDHKGVYRELRDKTSWEYIDTIGLTVKDIESFYQASLLDVVGKKKDEHIERKLWIEPSMVGYFYYFLDCYQRIPTQMEYIKFYYLANKKWITKNIGTGDYHQAFFGRLSRFYPSMLRDIHFYHVLKESGQFDKVLFSLKHDLEAKIDIFVKREGQWYGIQLRTKTKRSNEFYEKKKNRNPIHTEAILIDLPIDLNTAKSLNTRKDSIKLYDTYHVNQVMDEIQRNSKLMPHSIV